MQSRVESGELNMRSALWIYQQTFIFREIKMRLLLLVPLLLGLSVANASTMTIDFDDPNLPFSGNEEGFTTQGFSFTFFPVPIPLPPAYINNGSLLFCPDCSMAMESTTEDTFSLHSFDGYALDYSLSDYKVLEVTGFFEGGGTVVTSFPIILDTFQLFDVNWDSLVRVEFDNLGPGPSAVDNIVVSTVPIPAAVWLFGSGLGLLGWIRRRKTA